MRILKLRFFKQSATPNRIDKTNYLTQTGEIDNVIIKQTDNTLTPDFIMATNQLVYDSNYIWCEFTSRYYYITSFDVATGGRLILHTRVDVLMSFRREILASSSWVELADSTSDLSDDYNMLHNDFPFKADYDVLGKSCVDSLWSYWSSGGLNMVLIMK